MAELLKGAPVAAALTENLTVRCRALREKGVIPTLAVVRVGENPGDIAYEGAVVKRCGKIGIEVKGFPLPDDCEQTRLLDVIRGVNENRAVHGCLLFRPLPDRGMEAAACGLLDPAKDVDGMTAASLAGVFAGTGEGFPPCTAQACLEILDHYGVKLSGKHAVVVGRSLVIGRPVSMLLQGRDATVTMCHSKTENLPALCRSGSILVAAAGRAGLIGAACAAHGQVVLDVGTNVDGDGALRGDVDFDAVEPIAGAVTPVPGGVGAVTTAVLCKHVIEAAGKQLGMRNA